MFLSIKQGIKEINWFFFRLNELTKIIANLKSFKAFKEFCIYHLQLKIVIFEKEIWIHWLINFRRRWLFLVFSFPLTYVFFSILDYYLCLHHGDVETQLNALSFNSIEEDQVGFLEMSFFFEAGDWVSLGSWDLFSAWPVLYLYAFLATFSVTVNKLTDPFIAMWWLFVLSMFHADNDLFFEYLATTNIEEYFLWWFIYAVFGFIAWAVFDYEVQEFEERMPMEDRMQRMAKRAGKDQLFEYWFRDEPQHRAYDDLVKDSIKAHHFNYRMHNRKKRWAFWKNFTKKDVYAELLFMMTGFGFNHRGSLDELPPIVKKRYFKHVDKQDMEDFKNKPSQLPNYYEICPKSIQKDNLDEQMKAFKEYFRGPGHEYFQTYKYRVSNKWSRKYYYWLFFFKPSHRYWQGPLVWDPVLYDQWVLENPEFELSTIGSWKIKEWDTYSEDLYPDTSIDVIKDYELRWAYFKNYISLKKVIEYLRKPRIYGRLFSMKIRFTSRRKHRLYLEFFMFRTYKKNKP